MNSWYSGQPVYVYLNALLSQFWLMPPTVMVRRGGENWHTGSFSLWNLRSLFRCLFGDCGLDFKIQGCCVHDIKFCHWVVTRSQALVHGFPVSPPDALVSEIRGVPYTLAVNLLL